MAAWPPRGAPDDDQASWDTPGLDRPELLRVLESAARLQQVVPDAVLVGGAAAALWASHRSSGDHDHVLENLAERFDAILEAIEATDGWVTNRVTPGKVILGELGDIESGVRQLIRREPLEVAEVTLPSGQTLRVPTPDETLRIKGYLIVRRNQVRDYLDVAALSDRCGIAHAAAVLGHIDDYYADQRGPEPEGVATQLARQLADPRPADPWTLRQLRRYKDLDARWTDWKNVTDVCRSVAVEMVQRSPR
jgi:Nucleotidyl transferase AbiEii toxin, Type IV TA system